LRNFHRDQVNNGVNGNAFHHDAGFEHGDGALSETIGLAEQFVQVKLLPTLRSWQNKPR
jgi:hypothetical protein